MLIKMFIQLQDSCYIPTPVAVIRCTPHSHLQVIRHEKINSLEKVEKVLITYSEIFDDSIRTPCSYYSQ